MSCMTDLKTIPNELSQEAHAEQAIITRVMRWAADLAVELALGRRRAPWAASRGPRVAPLCYVLAGVLGLGGGLGGGARRARG